MLIIKVVRNLHLQYVVVLLPYVISFTNAQYIQHFLRNAFEIGRKFPAQDLVSSAVDVSRGLLLSANRAPIPTPAEYFDFGINLIVGYPTEQVFTAINTFCKCPCSELKPLQI